MKDLLVILDPAHGEETPGKRSPDGRHREYKWSRERCISLHNKLRELGYNVDFTNRTNNEIGLTKRANKANELAKSFNGDSIILSLHNDAFTNDWTTATGYSVYTSPGQTKSDKLAELLMYEFRKEFPDLVPRIDTSDGDLDKEENFTVLKKTTSPAVLIEWLFQNNKKDLEKIEDNNYNTRYEECIIKAINKWQQL